MPHKESFHIAVLPGDGIGPEITRPCIELLDLVTQKVGGFQLQYEYLQAGAKAYLDTGSALPNETLQRAKEADAILLAAMGLPDVRYPDGTEMVPQIDLREIFELYAGVRPVRAIPGAPFALTSPRAQNLDFVLVRESTEGLFSARQKVNIENDETARDEMVITRKTSERLFDFSFALARKRKREGKPGVLTCVDKANVLPSMAFFRKIFDERAKLNPDITAEHAYVDATALNFVRCPWIFDVLVTENMYGDILSDLGAGLIGGMGMAPSADIGDEHAVFQPCHGSAPDIAGTGKANPIAMFLSAAMMLDWLGDRYENRNCRDAAKCLTRAVDEAFRSGELLTCEFGGTDGTDTITSRVRKNLQSIE